MLKKTSACFVKKDGREKNVILSAQSGVPPVPMISSQVISCVWSVMENSKYQRKIAHVQIKNVRKYENPQAGDLHVQIVQRVGT